MIWLLNLRRRYWLRRRDRALAGIAHVGPETCPDACADRHTLQPGCEVYRLHSDGRDDAEV